MSKTHHNRDGPSGQTLLPPLEWAGLREEIGLLAPKERLPMLWFLLDGLEDQAPFLTSREVLHELMIVLLTGCIDEFPMRPQDRKLA